jgi:hypothetical protein
MNAAGSGALFKAFGHALAAGAAREEIRSTECAKGAIFMHEKHCHAPPRRSRGRRAEQYHVVKGADANAPSRYIMPSFQ